MAFLENPRPTDDEEDSVGLGAPVETFANELLGPVDDTALAVPNQSDEEAEAEALVTAQTEASQKMIEDLSRIRSEAVETDRLAQQPDPVLYQLKVDVDKGKGDPVFEWMNRNGFFNEEGVMLDLVTGGPIEDTWTWGLMTGWVDVQTSVVNGGINAVNETIQAVDHLTETIADVGIPVFQPLQVGAAAIQELKPEGTDEVIDEGVIPNVETPDIIPDTVAGDLAEGITQFAVGFVPVIKAVNVARGGAAVTNMGRFLNSSIAGGITDAVVFDPHEARLSDLLREWADLEDPVSEYLMSSPDDTEAEGRLKNALEGLLIGGVGELGVAGIVKVFGKSLDVLRAARASSGAAVDGMSAPVDSLNTLLGDNSAGWLDDKLFNRWVTGNASLDEVVDGVNWNAIKDQEGVDEVLKTVQDAIKGDVEVRLARDRQRFTLEAGGEHTLAGGSDDLMFTIQDKKNGEVGQMLISRVDPDGTAHIEWIGEDGLSNALRSKGVRELMTDLQRLRPDITKVRGLRVSGARREAMTEAQATILDARDRGLSPEQIAADPDLRKAAETIDKISKTEVDIKLPEVNDSLGRGVISDEQLTELASRIGLDPQDMLKRNPGDPVLPERLLAAAVMRDGAMRKMQSLANLAITSTDDTVLYAFMRTVNIVQAMDAQISGIKSEFGRGLRVAREIQNGVRSLDSTAGHLLRDFDFDAHTSMAQMNRIQAAMLHNGGADTVRELAGLVSRSDFGSLADIAKGSFKKRLTDMLIEAWYFNLLSSPATHVVNTLSTSVNTVWQIPERALAAGIGRLRGNADSVAIGEAWQMVYGAYNGFRDAFKAAGHTLATGETADIYGKVEVRIPKAITASNFSRQLAEAEPWTPAWAFAKTIDAVGMITRAPTRLISGTDEFFQTIGRSMEMHSLAYRKGVNAGYEGPQLAAYMDDILRNPSHHLKEKSQDFARSLTFTEELGRGGRAIQSLVNTYPLIGKLILPFVRTPINLLKWAGRRSPLGVLSSGIRKDIIRGGAEGDLALARMMMGTGLASTTMMMVHEGVMTGSGPVDPELRETWERTHQPFSVKIGDEWYSYNRADPFGVILGVTASLSEITGHVEKEEFSEYVTAIAAGISRSVVNKTWLTGPSDFIKAITQPERFGDRWIRKQLGTLLIPSGVNAISNEIDPVWRDIQHIMDGVRDRIPGVSENIPAMRNLWGEKIYSETLGPEIISPVFKYNTANRPVDDYMWENRIEVSMPTRLQDGVELTPEEYSRFVELAGNAAKDPATGMGMYDTLNAVIEGTHPDSAQWALLTDGKEGGRSVYIRTVVQQYRMLARVQLKEEFPDFALRAAARLNEIGTAITGTPSGGVGVNVPNGFGLTIGE